MKCEECKYWEELETYGSGYGVGYCHRYPPLRDEGEDTGNHHIWVDSNDWCGEFEGKEEQIREKHLE